jgi:hypothetical protein
MRTPKEQKARNQRIKDTDRSHSTNLRRQERLALKIHDGIVFLDLLVFEGTRKPEKKSWILKKTPIKKPKPPSSTHQSE